MGESAAQGSQVLAIAFDPDGTRLALAGEDGVVRFYGDRDGNAPGGDATARRRPSRFDFQPRWAEALDWLRRWSRETLGYALVDDPRGDSLSG